VSDRLKVLAPVRSLYMLDLQLEAGADEVYVSLADDRLRNLTHHSRPATAGGFATQVGREKDFRTIVARAHEHGVPVGLMANGYFVPPQIEQGYIAMVRTAVDAGVDYVAVGNLATIHLLREAGIDTPIAIGTVGTVVNRAMLRWLRDAGVFRVVLPPGLRLDEIKACAGVSGIQVITYATTGQGNVCGHCRMWECPVPGAEVGLGCRAGYRLKMPDGSTLDRVTVLDGATDCSLCSLAELQACGVYGIKVGGRESPNPVVNAKVVSLFARGVNHAAGAGLMPDLLAELDREEIVWGMMWKPRFCEPLRCSFIETPTTRYYV